MSPQIEAQYTTVKNLISLARMVMEKSEHVLLAREGNITMEFNTAGMYRASINTKGELAIGHL